MKFCIKVESRQNNDVEDFCANIVCNLVSSWPTCVELFEITEQKHFFIRKCYRQHVITFRQIFLPKNIRNCLIKKISLKFNEN